MKLSTASIFADNMVLQRGKKIVVWGNAESGAAVTVKLANTAACTAAQNGIWKVELAPLDACEKDEMIIEDDRGGRLVYKNVAIGEVWIAGGQSNMEMAMYADAEFETVKKSVGNTHIRFYDCPKTSYEGQINDEDYSEYGFWRLLTEQDLEYFSAAGYYFAEKVYASLGVPVGIVGCNWGGSPAASWTDESYLTGELECYLKDNEEVLENLDFDAYFKSFREDRARQNTPEAKQGLRKMMSTPMLAPMHFDFKMDPDKMKVMMNGPCSPFRACGLYHTMLEKIMPYAAAGAIWYQGEADVARANIYDKMFGEMIRCWRESWNDAFPFLFVQLAPLETFAVSNGNTFIEIRAMQDKVSKTIPDTYMACIMDAGMRYDIHPKQKRPVGERLALLALDKVYGKNVLSESPEAVSLSKEEGRLTVTFEHAGDGLRVEGDKVDALEIFVKGEALPDFKAEADGAKLVIASPLIEAAADAEVRFAQVGYCDDNLYNSNGLPAKPFILRA